MAKYHVIDPKTATYYAKPSGGIEWNLTKSQALKISESAIVIALDERNFNESLNVYHERKLYKQLHYDGRNGWIS